MNRKTIFVADHCLILDPDTLEHSPCIHKDASWPIEEWSHKYCEHYGSEICPKNSLDYLLTFHEEFNDDVICPFCGAPEVKVKVLGDGFYRCKECKEKWYLLRNTEEDE